MATDDFFRARLDAMIDLKHPLAVLSTRLQWAANTGSGLQSTTLSTSAASSIARL